MVLRRPPADPEALVFVKNVPKDATANDLRSHFGKLFKVQYCQVNVDTQGRPTHTGVVQLRTANEAQAAIKLYNRSMMNGAQLNVRLYKV